jgi:circadian clock protein KaiC
MVVFMDRISTGINGFDSLIEGGFPETNSILITGKPGTGKSIFGLQFLYNGIKQADQNGLFVSLEESAENLRTQALQFGWDLGALEKEGKLKILEIPVNVPGIDLIKTLEKNIKAVKAQRIVIDSLSVLILNSTKYKLPVGSMNNVKDIILDNEGEIGVSQTSVHEGSRFVYNFLAQVKKLNATSLIITDSEDNDKSMTKDGVSEFICDGVIRVDMKDMGKTNARTIEILKMRMTKMKPGFKTLEFTKNGIITKDFNY